MDLSFADCLREFRMLGNLPTQATKAPVLVNYGAKPGHDHERAFRTAFGRMEPQTQASMVDGKPPEQELGSVFLMMTP